MRVLMNSKAKLQFRKKQAPQYSLDTEGFVFYLYENKHILKMQVNRMFYTFIVAKANALTFY